MKLAYTPELAAKICERLAAGDSLRRICRDIGIDESTPRWWVVEDREGFAAQYRKARDMGMECMLDELLDIADDKSKDTYIDEDGNERCNKEWLNRSRLRVDTRKWYMSKVAPKRYGDKLETTLKGDPEAPIALILNGSDING